MAKKRSIGPDERSRPEKKSAEKAATRARTKPNQPGSTSSKRRVRPAVSTESTSLLIVIVPHPAALDDLVPELIDLGIDATVIQAKGLASLLRDDLPVFSGVASMLPQSPQCRLLLSIAPTRSAEKALELCTSHEWRGTPPLAAIIPISRVFGISDRTQS